MSEEKQYKIGDKSFYTAEMSVEQWEHMAGILQEFDVSALFDLKVETLFKAIFEKKLLRKFLAIALVPVNSDFDEEKLSEIENQVKKIGSQAMEVLQDFLSKNKMWIDYLKKLLAEYAPVDQAQSPLQTKLEQLSSTKPGSDTGSQTATSPKSKK